MRCARRRNSPRPPIRTKSRFLRAANHDLRQPLATLKILIYNCIAEPTAHRQDLLHAMDISVSIMEDLLGALLQIGQLDAGQDHAADHHVPALPSCFSGSRSSSATRRGEGASPAASSRRGAIVSDKALLERILSNLVANAIRYTEVGGSRGRLPPGRAAPAHRGLGHGTRDRSREPAGRIFEEFFQVGANKRRRRRQGSGLGLNIVSGLADLLGHDIDVRSVPGKGSVFSVTVPIGNVWHSDIGEPEISEMIGGEFVGLPVLLVEDDETLRQAPCRSLLERWGIAVTPRTLEGRGQPT